MPLVHFADVNAADTLDIGENLVRWDAETRESGPVDGDRHRGLAGQLLDGDIGAAGYAAGQGGDLLGFRLEDSQIIAEQLDPDIGTHAGDHLGGTQLYRLREQAVHPGQIGQFGIKERREFLLGFSPRPVGARLEHDENVGEFHAHGIGGHLRAPGARPDLIDLVGETGQEDILDPGVGIGRLFQRDTGQANGIDDNASFTQAGDELRAEPHESDDAGHQHQPR